MKKLVKAASLPLVFALLTIPAGTWAQEVRSESKSKSGEEIIITKKGDGKEKLVIEVDGDKITVNGKEYNKDNKDITIVRNRIKDIEGYSPRARVFFDQGGQNQYTVLGNLMSSNRTMLGVVTEKKDNGVEVQEITKESAAEKIGLKKGDIIKSVDGKKIESPDDLSKLIRDKKPGDEVDIVYLRDKKEQKAKAKLTEWKGASVFKFGPDAENFRVELGDFNFDELIPELVAPRPPKSPTPPRVQGQGLAFNFSSGPRLGISVQETEDGKGLKVTEVEADGHAAKSGIRVDDVITEVDGTAVNSTNEIAQYLRKNRTQSTFKFKVLRKGKAETVEVKIPKKLKTANL